MRKRTILTALTALVLALLCACTAFVPAQSPAQSASRSPVQSAEREQSPAQSPAQTPAAPAVQRDGQYTSPEEVAAYLHQFGCLPDNYISKTKARKLGWDSGFDLWDYAPGKSIGGGPYGNYEGTLPGGTEYRECDVNYSGGHRGAERVVYGADGSIWYTADHYKTFTRLY